MARGSGTLVTHGERIVVATRLTGGKASADALGHRHGRRRHGIQCTGPRPWHLLRMLATLGMLAARPGGAGHDSRDHCRHRRVHGQIRAPDHTPGGTRVQLGRQDCHTRGYPWHGRMVEGG